MKCPKGRGKGGWMEENNRLQKCEPQRTHNPAGFYSEDWDELQQEDNKWKVPDKQQRISQMVFCGGCLEIHSYDSGCISRFCTQLQGGGCSICEFRVEQEMRVDKRSMNYRPSTLQGRENYTWSLVNKLYLEVREMD